MGEPPDDEAKTVAEPARAPVAPRAAAPLPKLARYEVQRLLGRGGMGAVYLARQVELDRPAVVKVIAPELARDPVLVERLKREARAAAQVESEHVVKVYEIGTS